MRVISHDELVREAFEAYGVFSGQKPHLASTGFPDLDEAIVGMAPGHMAVFGSAPNVGKSTAAYHVARRIAAQGHKTLMLSLEDDPIVAGERAQVHLTGVSVTDLRLSGWRIGPLDERIRKALDTKVDNLDFGFELAPTSAEIGQIFKYVKEHGYNVLMIDYLQSIDVSGGAADNPFVRFMHAVKFIRRMATELQIVVWVFSQFNRDVKPDRDGNVRAPVMQDLASTSALEQFAQLIFLAWRDHGRRLIRVAKNKYVAYLPTYECSLENGILLTTKVGEE